MALNEDFKVKKMKTKSYDVIPKDVYQVELFDIDRVKQHAYNEPDKLETVFNFTFVILDKKYRGRFVWANFVPVYLYIGKKYGKNKLFKIVEALLGRDLTGDEVENGLDRDFFNSLIGKQCRVLLDVKVVGDKSVNRPIDFMASLDEKEPLTDKEKDELLKFKNKTDKEKPNDEFEGDIISEEEDLPDVSNIPF